MQQGLEGGARGLLFPLVCSIFVPHSRGLLFVRCNLNLLVLLCCRGFARSWAQVRLRFGLSPAGQRFSCDVTCDGSVMAEMARFCRCDGVMARIACVFSLRFLTARALGVVTLAA
jgi:hypothetical protein